MKIANSTKLRHVNADGSVTEASLENDPVNAGICHLILRNFNAAGAEVKSTSVQFKCEGNGDVESLTNVGMVKPIVIESAVQVYPAP